MKCEMEKQKRVKNGRILVLAFASLVDKGIGRRMNTKTTYFKILNTNCAEETLKHHDRVRARDASLSLRLPNQREHYFLCLNTFHSRRR